MAKRTPRMTVAARKLAEAVKPPPPPSGLSQSDLAARLGVSRALVSLWCLGESIPTASDMAKIEDAIGIPMREWAESLDADETTTAVRE